jgi:hypothetical protein
LTLIFKKQLIPKIREGKKTQTRRRKKPKITVGKIYNIRINYQTSLLDKLEIMNIFQQNLGSMSLEEVKKEGFENLDEFIETWTKLYGKYDPFERVWVIEFRYMGVTETFKEKN